CGRFGATRLVKPYDRLKDADLQARIGVDRWFMVEIDPAQDPLAVARAFADDENIEAASPDWRAVPAAVPTDPLHSMHWGHNNTAQMLSFNWSAGSHEAGSAVGTVGFDANAHAAWDGSQGYGSSTVIVAIIDSGVDTAHPDLTLVTGYDYGDNDSNPMDNSAEAGHGTCCAGVVASKVNNSVGAAGIAANCKIMPLKVASSDGSMYFSAIQNALYYAGDNGAHVISMSLGAAISSDTATDNAILYAYNKGCTILAATGNENSSTISYPAINSYVIGVGAASPCGERKRSSSSSSEVNPGVNTDPNGYTCDGERWWGSNYGTTTQNAAGAVDVIAPTILPTTDISGSGGYDSGNYSKWFNGTSCATPYAAGVCALIKSANSSFTNAQIRDRLVTTAQDVSSVESGAGWDRYTGYGMVDAAAAVGGGGPANSVTVTAPNGGETLTGGASYTITWTSTGSIANVKLEYSTNAGSSWTTITSSTTNDGSQAWTVPSSATSQGRVRVSDAANAATNDVSNANFTIQLPVTNSVTVTAPNGGETLTGGASYTITWTSTGTIANVMLEYSTNAGVNWTTITSSTPNDGSQAWTVPSTATTQGRVRVSDAAASATNDISNANFTIQVSGATYATLPYSTGFETGAVDQYWSTSSNNNGRVRLLTTNTPHGGSYHMCMDDATSGGYSQNVAWLRLNLAGYTQATLSFWWKDFNDETQTNDGVYFSSNGGSTFTKVYSLAGASYTDNTWNQFTLDVDQLAATAGLSLTSTFVVKFQQYDDYPMTTDGMAFDDISVTGSSGVSYITAESEPNNDSGTSDGPVGSGVTVSGSISSSTDDDWFYFDVTTAGTVNISLAIGSSVDLDWFLYNSGLTEVARGYSTSNPETGSYSATTGRYYLFVDGYNGATSSYTLSVTGGVGAALAFGPPKPISFTFEFHQSAPNPMTDETTIRFDLPEKSPVSLAIYDIMGREVATIIDRVLDAGTHSAMWDRRDRDHRPVAAGTYFARIVAGTDQATQRMIVLR
ncbi:MAG: S8 family serine peptidase, partial [Candidatus Eisenbacteria bacterium]|nr:S8 family serine peptidase [Candidatus Eisenbacteria bacterium]